MRKFSLRERVLMFFAVNPGEELNTLDIMAKFGVPNRVTVGRSLRYAVEHGVLNRRWAVHTVAVYSAGPALLAEVGRA